MKTPGQCDFGSCRRKAEVTLVVYYGGKGRYPHEKRPMCAKHADDTLEVMGNEVFSLAKEPLDA